ncbi:S-adenosyl-L-methionine-dependent methyltransferase [Pholiota molesta]|nr:S-adenosyl-L-methionine-dependent methyltransferase [Pholiota molesta]
MEIVPVSEQTKSLHKVNADAYDIVSDTYNTLYTQRPVATRVNFIQQLANDLSPGSKVLELGCGGGLASKPFIERGCDLTGIDISAAQIALAQQNIPGATLIHADIMSASFPPESLDAVVAMYSFLHLRKEEQEVIIGRIVKWLKPGGWLACNFPAMAFTDSDLGGVMNEWLGAKMFWHSLGTEGTRELLRDRGEGLKIIYDEVIVDNLDPVTVAEGKEAPEEVFQWIRAIKEKCK